MHPVDLCTSLESVVILVDSREQATKQAEQRYSDFGYPWRRTKLEFGDYSAEFILPDDTAYRLTEKVCIERKMSIDELCGCYTHDRERFTREFERAKAAGAKIYLLIEGASWEKIYASKYRSRMHSTALIASMLTWLARYNCQLIMCKPETSGKLISNILYREGKEILEKLDFD